MLSRVSSSQYVWFIVCLKAQNNVATSPYTLAYKDCRSLRRTAINLSHYIDQGDLSRGTLDSSLIYWKRRPREAYAPGGRFGVIPWSEVPWWNAVPLRPTLFGNEEDRFQAKLMRMKD